MITRNVFHYDLVNSFKQEYYKNIINLSDLSDVEIAIKDKLASEDEDEPVYEYFYEIRKGKEAYLMPSEALKDLPIRILDTIKIPHKNKAYLKITNAKSVNIREEQNMPYNELIDSWLDYAHEEKELLTLWKIIVDTAYCSRINVRAITYPGWMKDSPLTVLNNLRGDCVTVNKPSLAKLKYLLSNKNKVIGINEAQSVKDDDKEDLAKFYEDTGDFKPEYENPKRGQGHAAERAEIMNMSTLTFYNFPDEEKGETKQVLFDFIFHSKVKNRVFPLLFRGGTQKDTACKEKFEQITEAIRLDEVDYLVRWIRAHKFYEKNYPLGLNRYARKHNLNNTRWNRNYHAILSRVDLYCGSQEQFSKMEDTLMRAHKDYLRYIYSDDEAPARREGCVEAVVTEEQVK